jgi:flagellar biosynthetic protein FliR
MDVWLATLILARTASFIAVFPPWAGRGLPQTVKVGLAVALTVFWVTSLDAPSVGAVPIGWLDIALGGLREAVVGAVLAQVVGLILVPPRIAGAYIAQEMGLTLGALSSPMDQTPTDAIAQIFDAITLCLFFVLNGHHFVLRILDASFRTAPCGTAWPSVLWARCAIAAAGSVEAGLAIAASVGVVMLGVTVWLALAARIAPQMHLFSWGMSIRILIGLSAIALYLPELLLAFSRSILSRQGEFLLR